MSDVFIEKSSREMSQGSMRCSQRLQISFVLRVAMCNRNYAVVNISDFTVSNTSYPQWIFMASNIRCFVRYEIFAGVFLLSLNFLPTKITIYLCNKEQSQKKEKTMKNRWKAIQCRIVAKKISMLNAPWLFYQQSTVFTRNNRLWTGSN